MSFQLPLTKCPESHSQWSHTGQYSPTTVRIVTHARAYARTRTRTDVLRHTTASVDGEGATEVLWSTIEDWSTWNWFSRAVPSSDRGSVLFGTGAASWKFQSLKVNLEKSHLPLVDKTIQVHYLPFSHVIAVVNSCLN